MLRVVIIVEAEDDREELARVVLVSHSTQGLSKATAWLYQVATLIQVAYNTSRF